jgi:hypothetical protein
MNDEVIYKDDQNSHYYKLQIRYYLLEDQNLIEEFDKKKLIKKHTYMLNLKIPRQSSAYILYRTIHLPNVVICI